MTRSGLTMVMLSTLTVLTGCVSRDATLSQGVDDPCATINNLVAEYPEGFPSYRGKATNSRSITTFRATENLVDGHCEIWQWGGGDTAYTCSATAPSPDIALDRYQRSVGFLEQCLGPEWDAAETTRDRDGETDGQLTRFTSTDHPGLSVSAHIVGDRRGPGDSYTNYFYLGNTSQAPGSAD